MLMTTTTTTNSGAVRRGLFGALIVSCAVAAVAGWMIWKGQRPVQASIASGVLTVQAAGYEAHVALASIHSASLVDTLPAISKKVKGYAFGGNLRGRFELDELGEAMLFVDLGTPPIIVIRSGSGTVVVNLDSPEATRKLHAELTSARYTTLSDPRDCPQDSRCDLN